MQATTLSATRFCKYFTITSLVLTNEVILSTQTLLQGFYFKTEIGHVKSELKRHLNCSKRWYNVNIIVKRPLSHFIFAEKCMRHAEKNLHFISLDVPQPSSADLRRQCGCSKLLTRAKKRKHKRSVLHKRCSTRQCVPGVTYFSGIIYVRLLQPAANERSRSKLNVF